MVCSARASREVTLVCQPGWVSALAGISQSDQRSCSCQRSSLTSRVRMSSSRSRYKASWRISRSGPANLAVGRFCTPSRSAARAIASASIGSDFPRVRAPAGAGHQLRREAHDSLAAVDQEPLQRCRRRCGRPRPPTPARCLAPEPIPTAARCRPAGRARSGARPRRRAVDRRGGVGLLVRINSDRHHLSCPFHR